MSAARMSHQVDRPRLHVLDEGDDIIDMLRDRISVADAIPVIGKEMPQAHRDHAVFRRQRPDHRRPDAEIAQRAVDADQRRGSGLTLAHVDIGHVVSVDVKGLHLGLGEAEQRVEPAVQDSRNPGG